MPIYNGSQIVQEIYVGNSKISEVYAGQDRVFGQYPQGETIVEILSGYTSDTIYLNSSQTYNIKMVGAGGGGAAKSPGSPIGVNAVGGGSGPFLDLTANLKAGSRISFVVGKGGVGDIKDTGTAEAQDGDYCQISIESGNEYFSASLEPGKGAWIANRNSYAAGDGGSVVINTNTLTNPTIISTNGNAPVSGNISEGGSSLYNGYGAGGSAKGRTDAYANPGVDGYLLITAL